MISKVLSTIGIAFVASLLLVGCDEAAEEAKVSDPATKSAASGASKSEAKMGGSLKDQVGDDRGREEKARNGREGA